MKDMTDGEFFLTRKTYWDFIEFWQQHFRDLSGAIITIAWQCPDVWRDPEATPVVDLGKLRRFLEAAVGKEVMDKLLMQREEAAADRELCRVAAVKLWEIADALPPRDLGVLYEKLKNLKCMARHRERRERRLAERNARLAPRSRPRGCRGPLGA